MANPRSVRRRASMSGVMEKVPCSRHRKMQPVLESQCSRKGVREEIFWILFPLSFDLLLVSSLAESNQQQQERHKLIEFLGQPLRHRGEEESRQMCVLRVERPMENSDHTGTPASFMQDLRISGTLSKMIPAHAITMV